MRAVVLYQTGCGGLQRFRMDGRRVLRMKIMHHEQLVEAYFVHGDQIADRLLEGTQRLEVIEVSDVNEMS